MRMRIHNEIRMKEEDAIMSEQTNRAENKADENRRQIRAIVMDMDGTLLDENNEIPKETADGLTELEKQGIRLVLASGRSYMRLMDYAKQLKMEEYGGFLIEIDGVGLYDLKANQRTKFHTMSPQEIHDVFTWLMKQEVESQAMFDDGMFQFYTPAIRAKKEQIRKEKHLPDDFPWTAGPWNWLADLRNGYPDVRFIRDASLIDRPINKLQIMQEEAPLRGVYEGLIQAFGDSFSIYRTTPTQLEVLPKGYSKGEGLRRLMEQEGWKKDEVLVFGDGENDVSMFEQVIDSYAMGNAKSFVKDQAAHTAPSNREQGILQVLKSVLKI